MLSYKYRFHGHGSLRYVYKNGHVVRSRLMMIKTVPNKQRKQSRFAVVVSKKVYKGAVGRNRIRRRVYELIRHELPHIQGVHDVALTVVSAEVRTLPADELKQQIRALFSQAELSATHSETEML